MNAIAARFRYISKNGRLDIEDELGNLERGNGAVRDLAEDWRFGLHRWRETFSEMLRERGVDAEATRQSTRGAAGIHPDLCASKPPKSIGCSSRGAPAVMAPPWKRLEPGSNERGCRSQLRSQGQTKLRTGSSPSPFVALQPAGASKGISRAGAQPASVLARGRWPCREGENVDCGNTGGCSQHLREYWMDVQYYLTRESQPNCRPFPPFHECAASVRSPSWCAGRRSACLAAGDSGDSAVRLAKRVRAHSDRGSRRRLIRERQAGVVHGGDARSRFAP